MLIVALLLDIVIILLVVMLIQAQAELNAERQKPPVIERVVEYRYITTKQVVNAIAKWETGGGTTGTGQYPCNNPTGIAGRCFATLRQGYQYSYALWEQSYAQLDVESALARWKTGSQDDRSAETVAYIHNIQGEFGD